MELIMGDSLSESHLLRRGLPFPMASPVQPPQKISREASIQGSTPYKFKAEHLISIPAALFGIRGALATVAYAIKLVVNSIFLEIAMYETKKIENKLILLAKNKDIIVFDTSPQAKERAITQLKVLMADDQETAALITLFEARKAERNDLGTRVDQNIQGLFGALLSSIPIYGLIFSSHYFNYINESEGSEKGFDTAVKNLHIFSSDVFMYPLRCMTLRQFNSAQAEEMCGYKKKKLKKMLISHINSEIKEVLPPKEWQSALIIEKLLSFLKKAENSIGSVDLEQIELIKSKLTAKISQIGMELKSKFQHIEKSSKNDDDKKTSKEKVIDQITKKLVSEIIKDLKLEEALKRKYDLEVAKDREIKKDEALYTVNVDRGDGKAHQIHCIAAEAKSKPSFPCEEGDRPTMVIFGGNGCIGSQLREETDFYRNQGWDTLMVTLGGYPGSDSGTKTNEATTIQDIHAILRDLEKKKKVKTIGIHGHSIGCSVAMHATQLSDRVKCVILDKPFNNAVGVSENLLNNTAAAVPSWLVRTAMRAGMPAGEKVYGVTDWEGKEYCTDGCDNVKKAGQYKGILISIGGILDNYMGYDPAPPNEWLPEQQPTIFNRNFSEDIYNAYHGNNRANEIKPIMLAEGHSTVNLKQTRVKTHLQSAFKKLNAPN